MARPWEMDWTSPPSQFPQSDPYRIEPDPILAQRAAEAEERKRRAEARAQAQAQMTLGAQPLINEGRALENEAKRRQLDAPPAADAQSRRAAMQDANLDALVGQINEVQRLFNSGQRDNAVPLLGSLVEYLPTQANTEFDSAAAGLAEQGLAAFRVPGVGAQSDAELRQFVEANRPSTWSNDSSNLQRLKQLRTRVDATRKALGLPPAQWLGLDDDASAASAAPPGVTPTGNGNAPGGPSAPGSDMVRPWTPQDPGAGAATGGTRTVEDNPQLAAEYRARLAANQSAEEILGWLRSQGAPPEVLSQAVRQIQYRRANPNVPIESYSITSTHEVPLSLYDRAANAAGNFELPGGFSPGAYAVGAGQFLSGNTLDNLTADPERAQMSTEVMRASNPGSTFAGEMTGFTLGALTGEAGLARLGMASGIGRGILADTAVGAANGAGMADGGDRLAGAAEGGAWGAGGSLFGRLAMKGAARAFSPTGGPIAPLYEAGVRPTPGQRFANSGTPGRILNATEEALQSVPGVGSAIRGARQSARDQFQVGAFNEALKEIGEQLPKGMKPGTDPHAFAQAAFSRTYNQARSSMRLVPDEDLAADLARLSPDINTLGPTAQNKLKSILANTVNNRMAGGVMEGGAYQKAVSDLGKHIARYRKSPTAEDQALADVLQGIDGALASAARRHSDPAAVALLDAADAGYAKLVRIEEAARRRGGEPGTFSPVNFDNAVQNASGGVRSRAYLRGDALMQDFAKAGRSLDDKLPNSGTADRVMTGYAVGTPAAGSAIYMEPATATILGGIATAYAPGVRRLTSGVLAPAGPARKWIARQLEKRAQLLGTAGAAGAVASLPGTAPGQ